MPTPEELHKMGMQWFPIYYPMGPKSFLDGAGQPSGAVGAIAKFSKDIPNWPIMFLGLRINNVFELPAVPTDNDLRIFEACKRFVDDDQTVRIELSQQNITAEDTSQVHVVGRAGVYWAPFPVPFPMAGGNVISVTITRTSSYPQIQGEQITPTCRCTIVGASARNNEQTMRPHRVLSPA